MLKLTRFVDPARDVWIFAKHIIAITDDHKSTYVLTAAESFRVKETPEQILAMPEMQIIAASYRPTIVPKGLTWGGYNSNLEAR